MRTRFLWAAVSCLAVTALSAQSPAPDAWYQAIRINALPTLQRLASSQTVNVADHDGYPPLVLASAFGTPEAMQLLIDAGADVNAAATNGITPLHVAARDPEKVRLLLAKGAKVNAASLINSTPLLVAASINGASASVRLLLERGADANAADRTGITPLIAAAITDDPASFELLLNAGADPNTRVADNGNVGTALIAVAGNGNVALAKLLLARHVDVNAATADYAAVVKQGKVQLGRITALHAATLGQSADIAALVLDAGATVDAQDTRGMTPLMLAVSTDYPEPRLVEVLRRRGASLSIASKAGETPIDWARKFNDPKVLRALSLTPARVADVVSPAGTIQSTRVAVERSLPLLRTGAAGTQNDGGCVACHAQPLTGMASAVAERRGWKAAGPLSAAPQQQQALAGAVSTLLQPVFLGGAPDGQVHGGMMMATIGAEPNLSTDALAYYLASLQRQNGHWHGTSSAIRPPLQDGDVYHTALAVQVLAKYGTPALDKEFTTRIARAVNWLDKEPAITTQDHVMQVLGLMWGHADRALQDRHVKALLALQRANGGWGQTPNLPTDAYATGQALYALRESGLNVPETTLARGAAYLLRTQQTDGSWHVVSRAVPIQPYFESGFPYHRDQWVSQAGTAWAAMALTAIPDTIQVSTK